jgi:hypothetical protein
LPDSSGNFLSWLNYRKRDHRILCDNEHPITAQWLNTLCSRESAESWKHHSLWHKPKASQFTSDDRITWATKSGMNVPRKKIII